MKRIFLVFMIMCSLFICGSCFAASGGQNFNVYVDTKYYTINVPDSWKNDCLYSLVDGENYNYELTFYDKLSHEKLNGGGRLFSILLLPTYEDYTTYPEYDVLGSLIVYRIGTYNIIILYPSDVQFTQETIWKYQEMEKYIPDIIATISFKDECTYSKEPIPFTE